MLVLSKRAAATSDPQLLQKLLDTPNLKFLWALQETSGLVAKDYSGNGLDGTYGAGVSLNQSAPNTRVNKTVKFNGADKIQGPVGCSVKGLGAVTWFAVANIVNFAAVNALYMEPVVNSASGVRFYVRLDTAKKISLNVRTRTSTQTTQAKTTVNALPDGFCILHFTLDVPTNTIEIYRNGVALESTGTIDFSGDTIIEDTVPNLNPAAGGWPNNTNYYTSNMAYCGLYTRVLTSAEILSHAKAGGFA